MSYPDDNGEKNKLSEFNKQCIDLLYDAPNRHSKFCFLSSLMHLEKAYKLVPIDKEMAIFRAITAEEEAATGLMICLKELNYKNSDKLKVKDHAYKNAVSAFITVIISDINQIARGNFDNVIMKIDKENEKNSLKIGIPLNKFGLDLIGWPIPPLNLYAKKNGLKLSYKKKLKELIDRKGKKDVISYVRELANERNKILYASPNGVAHVDNLASNYIDLKRHRVFILLRAYLLIFPHKEKQQMVQDSLDAFLAMLGSIRYDGFSDK